MILFSIQRLFFVSRSHTKSASQLHCTDSRYSAIMVQLHLTLVKHVKLEQDGTRMIRATLF